MSRIRSISLVVLLVACGCHRTQAEAPVLVPVRSAEPDADAAVEAGDVGLTIQTLEQLVGDGGGDTEREESLRGVDTEGRFVCSETIEVGPGEDSAGCSADGYTLRAPIDWVFDGEEIVHVFQAGTIELSHVSQCGAKVRAIRGGRGGALERIAPQEVLEAIGNGPWTKSRFERTVCRDPRVVIERSAGVAHRMSSTFHVFRTDGPSGRVTLRVGGDVVRSWDVRAAEDSAPCGLDALITAHWELDLEILCAGDWAVVSGQLGPDRGDWECRQDGPTRGYGPTSCRLRRWSRDQDLFRLLVGLAGGPATVLQEPVEAATQP